MSFVAQSDPMTVIGTIGLAGLQSAAKQAETRSRNIANAFTPGYRALRPQQISSPYGPATLVDIPASDLSARSATPASVADDLSGLDLKGNDVNLPEEIVGLNQAEISCKLSVHLIRVDDELSEDLLNILA